MGWGVGDNETYPQILEKKIGLKVLNAGISSYGTVREIGLLNRIDTSNLKYLIIQYCPNDHEENISFLRNDRVLKVSSEAKFYELVNREKEKAKYYPGRYLNEIYRELKMSLANKKEYAKLLQNFNSAQLDRSKVISDYPDGDIEVHFIYTQESKNYLHLNGWAYNPNSIEANIQTISFYANNKPIPAKIYSGIARPDLLQKDSKIQSLKIGWSAELFLQESLENDTSLEIIVQETSGNLYRLKKKNKNEIIIPKTKYNQAETFLNVLTNMKTRLNEDTQLIIITLNDYLNNEPVFLEDIEKIKTNKKYPQFINKLKTLNVQDEMKRDNFFNVDDHINASGQKIVAEKLYQLIKK